VLPNLLVEGIRKALQQTSALRVFVCNVATQHGETDGFGVAEHVDALERHAGQGIVHVVVANNNIAPELPEAWHAEAVRVSAERFAGHPGIKLVEADVVAEENRYRHDPHKLAATIMRLYDQRDTLNIPPRRALPKEEPVALAR
jgi:uncharacterized cofD-like protein